jgi:hypothetical protein
MSDPGEVQLKLMQVIVAVSATYSLQYVQDIDRQLVSS